MTNKELSKKLLDANKELNNLLQKGVKNGFIVSGTVAFSGASAVSGEISGISIANISVRQELFTIEGIRSIKDSKINFKQ